MDTETPTVDVTEAQPGTEEELPFKFKIGYKKCRSFTSDRRSSSFVKSPDRKKEVCLIIESGVHSIIGRRKTNEDQARVIDQMKMLNEHRRRQTQEQEEKAKETQGEEEGKEQEQEKQENEGEEKAKESEGEGKAKEKENEGEEDKKAQNLVVEKVKHKWKPSRPRSGVSLPFGFFGVYDGHGGDKASNFVCNNLHLLFLEQANRLPTTADGKQWEECLTSAILKAEEKWLSHAEQIENCSGTTVAVVVVKDLLLLIGNVGDSEIVICGQDGIAKVVTEVHNPKRNPAEAERVTKAGGVIFHSRVGHPVVHPSFLSIAVSRALGDMGFKHPNFTKDRPSGIIADPFVTHLNLEPNNHRFVIIACDGLWDVMTYQKAADFVKERLDTNQKPDSIVQELVLEAGKTSMDNVTAILLVLDWSDKETGPAYLI